MLQSAILFRFRPGALPRQDEVRRRRHDGFLMAKDENFFEVFLTVVEGRDGVAVVSSHYLGRFGFVVR